MSAHDQGQDMNVKTTAVAGVEPAAADTSHERIAQLLRYIQRVEMLGHKPPYAIDSASLLGYQEGIEGLPGVVLGSGQEGEAWLEVERLAKTFAPTLPAALEGLALVSDAVSERPELSQEAQAGPRQAELQSALSRYIAEEWEPWAQTESRRRVGIKLYQRLFALHQTMSMDAADSPMELLWGIGMSSWRVDAKRQKVMHPLITQTCQIELGKDDFAMRIRPAAAMAHLEIDCYAEMELPGVKRLEGQWREFSEAMGDDISPFVEETFAPMLTMAAQVLCDSGRCELDAPCAPDAGPSLVVTGSWSLHMRRKSSHFLLRDVERLTEAVGRLGEQSVELPGFAKAFVERGSDAPSDKTRQSYRGMSSGSELEGAVELCFPLPYNQEQVRIIQELDRSSGVVVQGPPGTGKTHTIANVVAHYLAQGKKVLVTAKGETALSVIKEKLPEDIGRLCVALLSDEADGMRQFELSVSAIAGEVAHIDEQEQEARAQDIERRIDGVHASIALLSRQAAHAAELRMGEHEYQGEKWSTGEIARALVNQKHDYEWMEHDAKAVGLGSVMPLASDVEKARIARESLGDDVECAAGKIGELAHIPTSQEALSARHAMLRMSLIENLWADAALSRWSEQSPDKALEQASELQAQLGAAVALRQELDQEQNPAWAKSLARALAQEWSEGAQGPARVLEALAIQAAPLEVQRRALLVDAVELPAGAALNEEFMRVLKNRAAGSAGGLFGLWSDKEGKRLCSLVRVGGSEPASAPKWGQALAAARCSAQASALMASWMSCAAEFGAPQISEADPLMALRRALPDLEAARKASEFCKAMRSAREVAASLFLHPFSLEASVEKAQEMDVQLNLGREALAHKATLEMWAQRKQAWSSWSGPMAQRLDLLSDLLSSAGHGEQELAEQWSAARETGERLTQKEEQALELRKACAAIERAQAPAWADALLTKSNKQSARAIDGEAWAKAWQWRAWMNQLARAKNEGDAMEALSRRRAREDELAALYEDLAVARAWLGVKKSCVPSVAQKLRQYLAAVRSMGKGKGVRAERHRKTAREAMGEAYKAIPCWIMPHWRVSESMLSEIGVFDLVIVDEASQSDIWALPALLRGKKILVVGDHKQVSPAAVGVAEDDIRELSARFLAGQPHGSEMAPDKSIYDLASVVFADSSVMLREHFRCDPAIIEFSNKNFYGGQIKPLRAPTRRELMGAPLVDVLVKDGFRTGDKNPAEARAIVDMAKAICADPSYEGKSLGVVTLLGTEQAALIAKMVADEIAPADIVGRELVVGVPSMFQGRERSIMLVSMVLSPGNRGWADKLDMEQRLNVALSRARDKVFLFRSVEASQMPAGGLAAKLLSHFNAPFAVDPSQSDQWRKLCESDFEREMFDELTARGYKARPQFPCGGFRIDFVVEGEDGARLAVECDGDRYHGPERWSQDMARQRVLERAGWTFWRCFASDFAMDKRAAMESLDTALQKHGIYPCHATSYETPLVDHVEMVALAGAPKAMAYEAEPGV
jgi:very-short-patch-repair endonuclease